MRRTRRPRRRSGTASTAPSRWPTLDPEIHGDLDDLVRAINDVSSGEFQRLVAFYEAVDPEDREGAHERGQAAAARTLRRDVIHSLQEELIAWATPSQSARTGQVDGWLMIGPAPDQYDRRRALPALLDTALALTVQDELDDEDFETLFGPWRDAMGDADDEIDEPAETEDPPPVD